jgi:hypothetical protein
VDEVEGRRGVGLADKELEHMRTVSVGGGGGGTESEAAVEGRSQRRWRNRGAWGQEPWAVAVGDDIDLGNTTPWLAFPNAFYSWRRPQLPAYKPSA